MGRWLEAGLDLDRHEDGLRRVLRLLHNRQTGDEADVAEILAEQVLERKHYPPSEGYSLRHNVKFLSQGGNELIEIDHVVMRDGDVVGFGQTKNSLTESLFDDAVNQNGRTRRLLRNKHQIGEITVKEGPEIELSDFDLENIADDDVFKVGPVRQPEAVTEGTYEVVNYNTREVEAIFNTFQAVT